MWLSIRNGRRYSGAERIKVVELLLDLGPFCVEFACYTLLNSLSQSRNMHIRWIVNSKFSGDVWVVVGLFDSLYDPVVELSTRPGCYFFPMAA